jgi:hypothetical protein
MKQRGRKKWRHCRQKDHKNNSQQSRNSMYIRRNFSLETYKCWRNSGGVTGRHMVKWNYKDTYSLRRHEGWEQQVANTRNTCSQGTSRGRQTLKGKIHALRNFRMHRKDSVVEVKGQTFLRDDQQYYLSLVTLTSRSKFSDMKKQKLDYSRIKTK